MNKVLAWVRANVFIVIFVVVMVAALVTLPVFVAPGMNDSVRSEVETRARRSSELSGLEKVQLEVPGAPDAGRPGVVNEAFLTAYQRAVEEQRQDAEAVHVAALRHNRKGREVLMPELLPAPDPAQAQVLPKQFHERLMVVYDELLASLNAGGPPEAEVVAEELRQREAQFRDEIFKGAGDALTEEEQARLAEKLTSRRMAVYARRAEQLDLYVTLDQMAIPMWDQASQPSLPELFEWQWEYWIQEDVLKALHAANADEPSVIQAPVKRVLWLDPNARMSAASSGDSRGGMGSMGMGGGGGGGGEAAGGAGAPPNPRVPAPTDYSLTFTGRTTNPLYDVRYVDLGLVVDSARIPEVLDALAAYNFMTVVNMIVTPVNPYDHVRDGYFYGSPAVSQIEILLETVWLREWTAQLMPVDLKQALGIPADYPPSGGRPPQE